MTQFHEVKPNLLVPTTETFQNSDLSAASIAAWKASRNIRKEHLFILLLGPSAVGKSSLVEKLNRIFADHYHYIRPFTTRPGRPNETEKTSVSDQVFDDMEKKGAFVCVNDLYGYRFGTPLTPIREAQKLGKIPILDFPLEMAIKLRHADYDLVTFYILPSTVNEWRQQLMTSGRNNEGRYEAGFAELNQLHQFSFSHPNIDFFIVNPMNKLEETASTIHRTINQIKST